MKTKLALACLLISLVATKPSVAFDEFPLREKQKVTDDEGSARERFAQIISVSGDSALIASPASSTFIFRKSAGVWRKTQQLLPSLWEEDDAFGSAAVLDGNRAFVSSPRDDDACGSNPNCNSGTVTFFRFDGAHWFEVQKINAPVPADHFNFGFSLAIHEDTLVIGAPYDRVGSTGSVFIYRANEAGLWEFEQKLGSSIRQSNDFFGYSVAISRHVVLVGAPQNGFPAGDGYAALFRYDHFSSRWLEEQLFFGDPGSLKDAFGASVAIRGERAAIASEIAEGPVYRAGSVTLYVRHATQGSWVESQVLMGSQAERGDFFGQSLSMGDRDFFIGSPGSEEKRGCAYMFEWDGYRFIETQHIVASDRRSNDEFGTSLSHFDDEVLVGAPSDGDWGVESGSAYSFRRSPPQDIERVIEPNSKVLHPNQTTYYVGGPTDDFHEIQPAIDAAMANDLILVRPIKDFEPFVLSKPLTIMATSGRFTVKKTQESSLIIVEDIPEGERVCLAGIDTDAYSSVALRVRNCEGSIIIDDAYFRRSSSSESALSIRNCRLALLTEVRAISGEVHGSIGDFPAVSLSHSNSMISDLNASGFWAWGFNYDDSGNGYKGGTALCIEESHAVISEVYIRGGDGSPGDRNSSRKPRPSGGDGGAGVVIQDSSVLILGDPEDLIEGGMGGQGGTDAFGYLYGPGGDGGRGVVGYSAQVSGTTMVGGWPGGGSPKGEQGAPFEGDITALDLPKPMLMAPGGIQPGKQFQVRIQGRAELAVTLLISNTQGWVDLLENSPPLIALTGDFFLGLAAGKIEDNGILDISIKLDNDPALIGMPLTFQAIVAGDQPTLTNAVTRIVRP